MRGGWPAFQKTLTDNYVAHSELIVAEWNEPCPTSAVSVQWWFSWCERQCMISGEVRKSHGASPG